MAAPACYGVLAKRLAAREAVDGIVADWAASLDRDTLMARCVAAEVPIGPLNSIEDCFVDPHFRARENLTTVHDPDLGPVTVPSVVPRLSRTPGRIDWLGPALRSIRDPAAATPHGSER